MNEESINKSVDQQPQQSGEPLPPEHGRQRTTPSRPKSRQSPLFLRPLVVGALLLIGIGTLMLAQLSGVVVPALLIITVGGSVAVLLVLVRRRETLRGLAERYFGPLRDRRENWPRDAQRAFAVTVLLSIIVWAVTWLLPQVLPLDRVMLPLRVEQTLVIVLAAVVAVALVAASQRLYRGSRMQAWVSRLNQLRWIRALVAGVILLLALWIYYAGQFVAIIARLPLSHRWVGPDQSYQPSRFPLGIVALLALILVGTYLYSFTDDRRRWRQRTSQTEVRRRGHEQFMTLAVYVFGTVTLVSMLVLTLGWRAVLPLAIVLVVAAALAVISKIEDLVRFMKTSYERARDTVEGIAGVANVVLLAVHAAIVFLLRLVRIALSNPYEKIKSGLRWLNTKLKHLQERLINWSNETSDFLLEKIDEWVADINREQDTKQPPTVSFHRDANGSDGLRTTAIPLEDTEAKEIDESLPD